MKKIAGLEFDNLDDFNNFLAKATLNKIQMEIDFDRNEWAWNKFGNEVTEFNILSVLSNYLKEDVGDIIAEVDGYFGKCKIVLLLK